jgi:hypothetical protein
MLGKSRPKSLCHLTLSYSDIGVDLTQTELKVCSKNAKNVERNKLNKFILTPGFKPVNLHIQIVT